MISELSLLVLLKSTFIARDLQHHLCFFPFASVKCCASEHTTLATRTYGIMPIFYWYETPDGVNRGIWHIIGRLLGLPGSVETEGYTKNLSQAFRSAGKKHVSFSGIEPAHLWRAKRIYGDTAFLPSPALLTECNFHQCETGPYYSWHEKFRR